MLVHIKNPNSWIAYANGHVMEEMFFREFRRAGADYALLPPYQFERYFGHSYQQNGDPLKYQIDHIPVMADPNLPKDEVDFYVGKSLLGKMVNLWFPPEKKYVKKDPAI